MMWITFAVLTVIYVGLTILEVEGGEWSVFFKGLRILLIAFVTVLLTLTLLYDGINEFISSGVGLAFGFILYGIEQFITKKMRTGTNNSN